MTNKAFYELMDKTFQSCLELAKAKGQDYTMGNEDALFNFKSAAEESGMNPEQVCWLFMNKHYKAITYFVKTKGKAQSEPIEGRLDDLINYAVLLKAVIKEQYTAKAIKDLAQEPMIEKAQEIVDQLEKF